MSGGFETLKALIVEDNQHMRSLLRALEGAYRLSPKGSGTDVTYELSVDLIIPMIGLLKRKAERRLTDTALKDLKKRVEAE